MATAKRTKTTAAKPKPAPVRANLRDQFALAAMTGLIAMREPKDWTNTTKHYIASDAYAIADAMLLERGQKEKAA